MKMTSIGIYAGIGSGLLGAKWAGFEPIYNHEPRPFFNPGTFKHNFPRVGFSDRLRPTDLKPNLTISQPSCKAFSISSNTKRSDIDTDFIKDQDVFKTMRVIEIYQPDYFIVENVYGLLEHLTVIKEGGLFFNAFPDKIFLGDYSITYAKLNALEFGVPQRRRRVYIVGVKGKDTPKVKITPKREGGKYYVGFSVFDAFETITDDLPNMDKPKHAPHKVMGIKRLKAEETYYGSQGNMKLNMRKPSPVVAAAASRSLHPFEPRSITVRESARLMGYPDDFIFYGKTTNQLDQVGKAVVPQVIYSICIDIRRHAKQYGIL